MTNYPTWEVKLSVNGPIKTQDTSLLRIFKDFQEDDPFYSDVKITDTQYGVLISVTAFASNGDLAHKAALLFVGQMLDSLSLSVRQPLFPSFSHEHVNQKYQDDVRRIITRDEWIAAFKDARLYNEKEPTYLRALGWYRKGLYTNDPYDKFLAYWNSIEITATKYHTESDEAKEGSKNQIWECFKKLWGECKNWPIIHGNDQWIKDNYEIRKDIAHGLTTITVEGVIKILTALEEVEQVAYKFLADWRGQLQIRDHLNSLIDHIGIESS
jgi:hypothetical protein